jgi:hypothetical protein
MQRFFAVDFFPPFYIFNRFLVGLIGRSENSEEFSSQTGFRIKRTGLFLRNSRRQKNLTKKLNAETRTNKEARSEEFGNFRIPERDITKKVPES